MFNANISISLAVSLEAHFVSMDLLGHKIAKNRVLLKMGGYVSNISFSSTSNMRPLHDGGLCRSSQ